MSGKRSGVVTAKRPPKPPESPWIAPYLTVKDVDQALLFYEKAFGFERKFSFPGPGGKTAHAEMIWQDSSFMLGAEGANTKCKAPVTTGIWCPVTLYVYCENVDKLYKRATAAGAKAESMPEVMFWGDRVCTLNDHDGHVWHFATNVADFDPSKAPQ